MPGARPGIGISKIERADKIERRGMNAAACAPIRPQLR
jgi:hypothetical protein